MTIPNLFETRAEAKEYCLSQFCKVLCESCTLCNFEIQITNKSMKDYWRNCLPIRLNLCPHYSYRQVLGLKKEAKLAYCDSPTAPKAFGEFCLGKQCKDLPVIEIAEEQPAITFDFGANIFKGKDFKMAAAGDGEDENE